MDESSAQPRPFAARTLPWLLGLFFLVLYLATLHPWVGVSNARMLGQLGGWDPDTTYSKPLLWLITRPLLWISGSAFPGVLNGLAAVCGALSVALLARSVALLPHDRMREQRIRGHGENPLLHIRLAWLPVVFAAALLGFQRTFWENATLQTGEMLDLLVFAGVVAALVEYRTDLRERWLWISAFLMGVGITGNWAMVGFASLYLVAVIWLRGWSFFDAGFLGRMTGFGMAGLLFYLLIPLVSAVGSVTDLGFWTSLKANWVYQRTYLQGIPRGRPLLLFLVMVLPLGLIAIRWQGTKGSSLERIAAVIAIILLQVMWYFLAVYLAFDPPFSPRKLLYLDKGSGELAMLTFSFCSALAAGYFSGWFLLVGGTDPDKQWEHPNPGLRLAGRAAAVLAGVAGVAVPVALAVRNLPAVRAQNSTATRDLAAALAAPLPATPQLILSDDPVATQLLMAELETKSGGTRHVVMDTLRGSDPRYRKWIASRSATTLPELKSFADAKENVAGVFSDIVARAAAAGPVRYLNPSFGFFFERIRLLPDGVAFTCVPVGTSYTAEPVPAPVLTAALSRWNEQAPRFERVVRMRDLDAPDARNLTEYWSRSGDSLGVDLQRAGRLEDAGKVFEQARRLNPNNPIVTVNARVNEALRSGKPPATNLVASLAQSPLVQTLGTQGPVDEPVALLNIGRALLGSADRLPRQAWLSLNRSRQLAPGSLAAQFGEVEALIQGGQLDAARRQLDQITREHPEKSLGREDYAAITRLEIYLALSRQDLATAEKLIEGARSQFAADTSLIDLLTALYIRNNRLDEAVPLLEQWRKLRADDPAATLRLSTILISRRQFDQALRIIDPFLGLKSDNVGARINRAICLFQLGRLDDARREYQGLAEKLPDLALVQFGLGEIAVRQKNTNAALQHFEKYLKTAATNTTEYADVTTRVNQMRGNR
ncbi:MAG: tetratricopeptide repeat protein [Verrucomicrobiales bacterium]|nr:tetratricopeptide repeat protein [Verrucomicrobiales bacterium]